VLPTGEGDADAAARLSCANLSPTAKRTGNPRLADLGLPARIQTPRRQPGPRVASAHRTAATGHLPQARPASPPAGPSFPRHHETTGSSLSTATEPTNQHGGHQGENRPHVSIRRPYPIVTSQFPPPPPPRHRPRPQSAGVPGPHHNTEHRALTAPARRSPSRGTGLRERRLPPGDGTSAPRRLTRPRVAPKPG